MRTGNIGGIQGGRRPEPEECHKPTVVAGSGADLQERLVERKAHKVSQAHNAHITQRGVCPLINNVSRISDE